MGGATIRTATRDVSPAASQAVRQLPERKTTMAETAMPVPTPEKGPADRPGRPPRPTRSSTSAEEYTSPKALATPPAKRRRRKAGLQDVTAMEAVVSALTRRATRSQRRREPGRPGMAATSAPAKIGRAHV